MAQLDMISLGTYHVQGMLFVNRKLQEPVPGLKERD